jgi:hypothetical protein
MARSSVVGNKGPAFSSSARPSVETLAAGLWLIIHEELRLAPECG